MTRSETSQTLTADGRRRGSASESRAKARRGASGSGKVETRDSEGKEKRRARKTEAEARRRKRGVYSARSHVDPGVVYLDADLRRTFGNLTFPANFPSRWRLTLHAFTACFLLRVFSALARPTSVKSLEYVRETVNEFSNVKWQSEQFCLHIYNGEK